MAVVYTDGYSQDDPLPAAQAMEEQGIVTYAVAVEGAKHRPNYNELLNIARLESRIYTTSEYPAFVEKIRTETVDCVDWEMSIVYPHRVVANILMVVEH